MAPAGYGNRVEGLHAVRAAAEAGRVEELFVDKGRSSRSDVGEIIELVGHDRACVVDDIRDLASSEAPQGVMAECVPRPFVELDSLAGADAALLVLDHLEDPQNVGAIARSAVAAGVSGLVISTRRAAPLSPSAFKAAAGALESLKVAGVGSIPEAMARLKDRGVWMVGLDAAADVSLFGLGLFTEAVGVVVGAEGKGPSELVSKRCDILVSIPMAGSTESLNASVSAALASFEIMRVRTASK